ncbi:MAG: PaaI family thioesterase [Chloroflexota bacterium]
MFKIKDPDYKARVAALFSAANFIQEVGYQFLDCGPGWCETELNLLPKHTQQDRFVHAGVQSTMADHAAGAAAGTLLAANEIVLTVEFKINLLRTAAGEKLFCRAEVLRPGSRVIVAESAVYAVVNEKQRLVSKAMVTLTGVTR